MNPIRLILPRGAEASNYLYPVMEREDLTQDVLTVELPNGYFIDVGWYPEHDESGSFWIRVFLRHWDGQVIPPITGIRDPYLVARRVEGLAGFYCAAQVPTAQA